MTVAALVMAGNEELMLPGCLSCLSWADERIVLVDHRSTDGTEMVARAAGASVYREQWHGFAGQRNRLAQLARSEWLLYVDADERIPAALAASIRRAIRSGGEFGGYEIPTLNVLLGRPLSHGGWWPDSHVRLIRRSALDHWSGALHEVPIVAGRVGLLDEPIVHMGHRNLSAMLTKTAVWGPLDAQRKQGSGPVGARELSVAVLREVGRRLVRRGGWCDGTEGWIEVLFQSFSAFLTVAFLWESQRREPLEQTYRRLDEHLQGGGTVKEFFDRS